MIYRDYHTILVQGCKVRNDPQCMYKLLTVYSGIRISWRYLHWQYVSICRVKVIYKKAVGVFEHEIQTLTDKLISWGLCDGLSSNVQLKQYAITDW